MKNKKIIFIFLTLFLVIGALLLIRPKEKDTMADLNQYKQGVLVGQAIPKEKYYKPYLNTEDMMAINQVLGVDENYSFPGELYYYNLITNEKFEEDINYLFEALKLTYGGYEILGEENFERTKKEILNGSSGDWIQVKDMVDLIHKNLNFIDDKHFTINSEMLKSLPILKMDGSKKFIKKKDDYILEDTSLIVEEKDAKYIKPYLNEEGDIMYKAFLKANEGEFPDKINFTNGGSESFNWEEIKSITNFDEFAFSEKDGIAILKMGSFPFPFKDETSKENYNLSIESMKKMGKEKYSILDLTSNMGGNAALVNELIEAYTNHEAIHSFFQVKYDDGSEIDTSNMMGKEKEKYDYFKKHFKFEKVDDYHLIKQASEEMIANDKFLFILMSDAGSAGELMIDGVKHIENAITVGVPSSGVLVGSIEMDRVLPNSKINFVWGISYISYNKEVFREYYGFEPDIWVEPEYAEERLIKLINKRRD